VIVLVAASDDMNILSDNEDYDIGEDFIISYPDWIKLSKSGVKTNLRKSNGKNCFVLSVIYAYAYFKEGKTKLTDIEVMKYKKMFNWNGIDTNGTVNREQILKWNKNNPLFFLTIYLFNGMNEETSKKDFLDGYEVWIAPPNDVEGKEMIPLLFFRKSRSRFNELCCY